MSSRAERSQSPKTSAPILSKWRHHWTQPGILALETITEFSDGLAIRKILEGIKGRVEGHNESFAKTTTEFFIYLTALVAFFPIALYIAPGPATHLAKVVGRLGRRSRLAGHMVRADIPLDGTRRGAVGSRWTLSCLLSATVTAFGDGQEWPSGTAVVETD